MSGPGRGRRDVKPWGSEVVFADTDKYLGKLLYVDAGHRLSLQYHSKKEETMIVVSGSGVFQLGDHIFPVGPGDLMHVNPGQLHRISSSDGMVVAEVSTPHHGDTIRIEDQYGRAL
jgi:mannose-6-phosphate isomerase-like protein (cupin superfamily)